MRTGAALAVRYATIDEIPGIAAMGRQAAAIAQQGAIRFAD
jgi:hypothetical protein